MENSQSPASISKHVKGICTALCLLAVSTAVTVLVLQSQDISVFRAQVADSDGDGVPDTTDNCPNTPNGPTVFDGICGIPGFDACPPADPGQHDEDGDGIGDACDPCIMDMDYDGYGMGTSCLGSDCNDADASIHAGAAEICDQIDNNCDGQIDEGDVCAPQCPDNDGDGFSTAGGVCGTSDCNDADDDVHPGAEELCNGADDDCDGITDEGNVCDYYDDDDADGVINGEDNCMSVSNPNQEDFDDDNEGDACDTDIDGDLVLNASDNCPAVPNGPIGCEIDPNIIGDSCVGVTDPGQQDSDNDGLGDVCDPCLDADGDGYGIGSQCTGADCNDTLASINPAATEICDSVDNDCDAQVDEGNVCLSTQDDSDGDGINDVDDNCPFVPNPGQIDSDGDGAGNLCDADDDDDTVIDSLDNCPLTPNGPVSECEEDPNIIGDVCPAITDPGQHDSDGDGAGDACDPCTDDDEDGYGEGAACYGPDCDDSDPLQHSGAAGDCSGADLPGSIRVCKVVLDDQGNIIDGSSLAGTTFTVPPVDPPVGHTAPGTLTGTTFVAPMTYQLDIMQGEEIDAECVLYTNLTLGEYFYGQEIIENTNQDWDEVLYNDDDKPLLFDLFDVFPYDDALFNLDPLDDIDHNPKSDGLILLTSDKPSKTLTVVNRIGQGLQECSDLTVNFSGLSHGTILAEQYANQGVHLSASANNDRPDTTIVFDSGMSGTPDPDLEVGIGNLSIIPKNITDADANGLVDIPNDSAYGGTQVYEFDHDRDVLSFVFVDKDGGSSGVATAYNAQNVVVGSAAIPNLGDGSVQTVTLNAHNVRRLEVTYPDSGGMTDLSLSCTEEGEDCQCTGGVSKLQFLYNGANDAVIRVWESTAHENLMVKYTGVNDGDVLLLDASDSVEGTLPSSIAVATNGGEDFVIDTSCATALEGLTFGSITIQGQEDSTGEVCGDVHVMCTAPVTLPGNGTAVTNSVSDVTFKSLGSAVTYGAGGPEVSVYVDASFNGGSSWSPLFGAADIDGGEVDVFADVLPGSEIALRVRGKYRSQFDQTFTSTNQDGHLLFFFDGDEPPDVDAYDNQTALEDFLQDILDENGLIDIGQFDILMLVELGSLGTASADFQDAVVLITFSQDANACVQLPVGQEECECEGRMRNLSVRYNGPSGADINVYGHHNHLPLIASYTNVQNGQDLFIDGTNLAQSKLESKTVFVVDDGPDTSIHTSCSEEIMGQTFGDFTVLGHTDSDGSVCGVLQGTIPPTGGQNEDEEGEGGDNDHGSAPACTPLTTEDYDPEISCHSWKTFKAYSQADLDEYEEDYGLSAWPSGTYKDLYVYFNMDEDAIELHSPCKVYIRENKTLTASESICIDGKKGVVESDDISLQSPFVTVVSSEGSIDFVDELDLDANTVQMTAKKTVSVGKRADIDVTGDVTLRSTGTSNNIKVTVHDHSIANIEGDLTLDSLRKATIGKSVLLDVGGTLTLKSTGTTSYNRATIDKSSDVAAQDIDMTSGKKAEVNKEAEVTAENEFFMDAPSCSIHALSIVNADLFIGSCF